MAQYCLAGEAAHELNCSSEYVRVLERTGRLPALRTTRGVRLFRPADVQKAQGKAQ